MKKIMLALALCCFVVTPSAASDAVTLDDGLRAHLAKLPSLNGKSFNPSNGPVTLVTFFASWCPPCREEFRHLNKLRAETSDENLQIVAINILENFNGLSNPGKLKRFLKKTKPTFVTVEGNDAVAKTFENVTRLPTVFVFDRQGRKTTHFVHKYKAKKMSMTYDELKAAVTPLF